MERLFLMFLDHTKRRSTVGRTPLDEWSARRRDLYLTTHNTHNRQISMLPVGFEPTISAVERPDQLVAETSTWQHTTLTTDKYPCPRWYSNPRSQHVSGLWPLACWDRGFESHRGHGYFSVVSVVCCQVEVSATSWSLVQRSPTDCGASLCVI